MVGGYCRLAPGILGITEFNELPQDLYSSARATALAQVDARYDRNALPLPWRLICTPITRGPKVSSNCGVTRVVTQISEDHMQVERRPVGRSSVPVSICK